MGSTGASDTAALAGDGHASAEQECGSRRHRNQLTRLGVKYWLLGGDWNTTPPRIGMARSKAEDAEHSRAVAVWD